MKTSLILITLLTATASQGIAQSTDDPVAAAETGSAPAAGSATEGQRLYYQTGCYACHGTIGQGAFLAGPKLTPPLIPYEAFSYQLREPANRMPRYSPETMSDQQIADIYAYMEAVPEQPKAADIDILRNEQ